MEGARPGEAYEKLKGMAQCIERSRQVANAVRSSATQKLRTHLVTERKQNSRNEGSKGFAKQSSRSSLDLPVTPVSATTSQPREVFCSRCKGKGHFARDCITTSNARTSQSSAQARNTSTAGPFREKSSGRNPKTQDDNARAFTATLNRWTCGTIRYDMSQQELFGEQTVAEVSMLGKPKKVLLDTGSQISIMPLKILVAAHQEGFDLNKDVEEIPFTSSTPIYDASGNEMEFKGAIRLTIQMGQSAPQRVAMLVRKTEDDMVVFGTNILSKLGLSLERKQNSGNAPQTRDEAGPSRRVKKPEQNPRKLTKDKSKPAVVTSRVYIRPGETKPLVISSGTPGKDQMLWSNCEVIPDAVCHADQSVLKLPVTNTTDVPKTFRIGKEVGHWDDSWVVEHSSASHANMLEQTNSDSAERKELLWKALLNNKTTTEYDEPLRGVSRRRTSARRPTPFVPSVHVQHFPCESTSRTT
ncbi:hypothetical protein Aduo_012910 [Ancylostoma duodenale]